MKLPIKDQYFNEIKRGLKDIELRDGHITFVNEKTGEKLLKKISGVFMVPKKHKQVAQIMDLDDVECFDPLEPNVIVFFLD